jgi:hypothetical protein
MNSRFLRIRVLATAAVAVTVAGAAVGASGCGGAKVVRTCEGYYGDLDLGCEDKTYEGTPPYWDSIPNCGDDGRPVGGYGRCRP